MGRRLRHCVVFKCFLLNWCNDVVICGWVTILCGGSVITEGH